MLSNSRSFTPSISSYSVFTLWVTLLALFCLSSCQISPINHSAFITTIIEKEQFVAPKDLVIDPVVVLASQSLKISPSTVSVEHSDGTDPVDSTQTVASLWNRVRTGMKLDVPDIRRVRLQRDWYAKNQKYLDRVIKRAEPFLYLIVDEIEKRQMPMELVLLPIVESAYDPFAYSFGRASGMWQFIPGTGKRFGLEQNWWYDGRRDVVESTRAALDYLQYLHKYFKGDWLHALAAYNSGEGNVGRAIRKNRKKNKPIDFWNLKLPKETKAYVPKLLALAELLKNEDKFKLIWKDVNNEPLLTIVEAKGQIDIAFAAELADISVDEFYKLNPAFNRWSTPPKGPHHLLLPIEKAPLFLKNLADTNPSDRVKWVRYNIKNGDSLIRVARQHNTTADILRSVNNINGNKIKVGDKLLIPTASQSLSKYSLSSDSRLKSRQKVKRGDNKINYKVRSGDSFWKIANQYKVNIRKLASSNGMAPTDPLKIGQKLVIWTKQSISPVQNQSVSLKKSNRVRKINYRVRKGDSLARISNKFSVRVRDLKRWNNFLLGKKYIQPGERLTLYVDITSQSGS